jgi:hypothetical protein
MKDSSWPMAGCDKTPQALHGQAFQRLLHFSQLTVTKNSRLLRKLPNSIKEACDALPQISKESGVFDMTVTVSERDDAHTSHENIADSIQIWDVRQQDQLVGMFHQESDAQRYASELEEQENKRLSL